MLQIQSPHLNRGGESPTQRRVAGKMRVPVVVMAGIHPRALAMSNSCGHWQYTSVAQAQKQTAGEQLAGSDPRTYQDSDWQRNMWWQDESGGDPRNWKTNTGNGWNQNQRIADRAGSGHRPAGISLDRDSNSQNLTAVPIGGFRARPEPPDGSAVFASLFCQRGGRVGTMFPLTREFEIEDDRRFEMTAALGLLSFLWAAELTRDSLVELTESELSEPWRQLGGWLPATADDVTDRLLEELAVDYCQLLVGPRGHLPPVQSVWDSSRFQSDSARSMQQFISGMEVFDPCVPLVDHLAVQLQYAARLYSVPLGLLKPPERGALCELAGIFFDRHLTWPGPLLERIEGQSQTMFYRGLARVTRKLLFAGTSNGE